MTRRALLRLLVNHAALGLATYSPGDGLTRYRFFPSGSPSDYFGAAELYTALGVKEALTFVRGYIAGREVQP